jgi:hypothetical protein
VQKLRWKVDIRKHIIRTVVHDVLEGDVWWGDDNEEEYEAPAERAEYSKVEARKHAVPKPMIEEDCNVSNSIFFSELCMTSVLPCFSLIRIATSGSSVISRMRSRETRKIQYPIIPTKSFFHRWCALIRIKNAHHI